MNLLRILATNEKSTPRVGQRLLDKRPTDQSNISIEFPVQYLHNILSDWKPHDDGHSLYCDLWRSIVFHFIVLPGRMWLIRLLVSPVGDIFYH